MWIAPYPRDAVPDGIDHSEFGAVCVNASLSSINAVTSVPRTIMDFGTQYCLGSTCFDHDGSVLAQTPNFLSECTASFSAGFSDPIRLTNFLPDHASFMTIDGEPGLIEESTWHSELFYSYYFRVDRTTQWKWRARQDWTVDLVVPRPVNHCYHRFHFQYFHWLFDLLPRVWLLKTLSPYGSADRWVVGPLTEAFQAPSLALFDITPDQCFWPRSSPATQGTKKSDCIVQFDQAIRPEFTFREPLKTRPSYSTGIQHKGWSRRYVEYLRERAWLRYAIPAKPSGAMLYITRRNAGHRTLRNEAAIEALLLGLGFQVIDPGTLRFEDQVRAFAGAQVVVGIHGAGMANIVWCRPGATVLELLPGKLDDIGYRFLSNLCGHAHGVLLCEQFEHQQGIAYADIGVNVEGLRRALRQMLGLG